MFQQIRGGKSYFTPPPPPPPPPLPPPRRTPPQRQPPHHHPPHPREWRHLQPSCLASRRTTWAASWRGAWRTPRTSPSRWHRGTRHGVLGVHADGGRVLATESFWVKTLLQGLLPQLGLLPLLQLIQLIVLSYSPLLVVVFVGFKSNDNVEQLVGLGFQVISVHLLEGKGLDPDGEGNLLLLLQLLLGLGHLATSITTSSCLLTTSSSSLVSLLSLQHLLSLGLSLFQTLLLLLSLLCLLFIFFFSHLLLLFFLLLVKLLLLLGPDLLPLGLLLLQLLQLLLLLLPGLPPLIDVLFEGFIQSCL